MISLFRCPLCAGPLRREGNTLRCPSRHAFDLAREGYANLLPVNRRHSKVPGDDREMVAARSAFLDKDYYLPLRTALEEQALICTQRLSSPVVVDSGCGEGWYTAGIFRALTRAGQRPAVAGVDISKFALRRAPRRLPEGEFAVASCYHLPLRDGCADLLLNIFSPLAAGEFARVLRPDGTFLYVVPSARHLWQMKQVLYEVPYENPVKTEEYPGFRYLEAIPVRGSIRLEDPADIAALFQMTPYAWKTPREGIQRLRELPALETEIGFDIHIYRKTEP